MVQQLNYYVEPFIRFKFKKLNLDQIKQYKRMSRLTDTALKKMTKGGAKDLSDSESDD
jgi:hypothetical protein